MLTIVRQFEIESMIDGTIPFIVVEHPDHTFSTQLAVESIEDGEGRMFGEMDLTGTPFDDDMSHLTPRFVTADAAQQLSELEADYDNVGADLRAFDAPSECDLIAYQGWERRNAAKLAALRALCVNLKHAASPVL